MAKTWLKSCKLFLISMDLLVSLNSKRRLRVLLKRELWFFRWHSIFLTRIMMTKFLSWICLNSFSISIKDRSEISLKIYFTRTFAKCLDNWTQLGQRGYKKCYQRINGMNCMSQECRIGGIYKLTISISINKSKWFYGRCMNLEGIKCLFSPRAR